MNAAAAANELAEILSRADEALARGDMDGADEAMEAASNLCRRLQSAGLEVPAGQLAGLRELADGCGSALARLSHSLQDDSLKQENLLRGIASYQSNTGR